MKRILWLTEERTTQGKMNDVGTQMAFNGKKIDPACPGCGQTGRPFSVSVRGEQMVMKCECGRVRTEGEEA